MDKYFGIDFFFEGLLETAVVLEEDLAFEASHVDRLGGAGVDIGVGTCGQ